MVDNPLFLSLESPPGPVGPWLHEAITRAHMLHQQMDAAQAVASASRTPELRGMNASGPDSPYMLKLAEFCAQEIALARLLDSADLLVRAEGPGVSGATPRLASFNWLCAMVERQIKNLAGSILPMLEADKKLAVRELDLRLCGMAPGSLYAGFSLEGLSLSAGEGLLSKEFDSELLAQIRRAIHCLPLVPQFVGTDGIDTAALAVAIPDPAMRDAAMVAALQLAPTGSRGIHTLEITAPKSSDESARRSQSLGQPQRLVLKQALRHGAVLNKPKTGQFAGTLRALDLDGRAVLSDVSSSMSALRCSVPSSIANASKAFLGEKVTVIGQYEEDRSGKPRLMRASQITLANGALI
ncbi:MAG: hypothetical protein EAZ34_00290 [Polaromonas sp.]|nr:MAG: hypothetical protein EAZ34_00290 [Polaromonas sp.]